MKLAAFITVLAFSFAPLHASIVITPTVSVSETATTATVTVDIFGKSSVVDGELVGFYGFKIDAPGVASGITASFAGQSGSWVGAGGVFGSQTHPTTSSYSVGPAPVFSSVPSNNLISNSAGNQIGRMTFQIARTLVNQSFSLTALAAPAPVGSIGLTAGSSPNGFLRDDRSGGGVGTLTNVGMSSDTANFTVNAITAVPEPTSLMLLGFAGSALVGSRLRKRRSVPTL